MDRIRQRYQERHTEAWLGKPWRDPCISEG